MNGGEGNANTANGQASPTPMQNMQPASAVSASFDASKLGDGQKSKKIKKDKTAKNSTNGSLTQGKGGQKRPVWFWYWFNPYLPTKR